MEWIELIIHTTTAGSEPVSDILMESGASGTMIEDKADIPDPSKPHGIWEIIDPKLLETMPEDVLVHAWFENNAGLPSLVEKIRNRLAELSFARDETGSLLLDTVSVNDESWKDTWKKYYKPFYAGKHLLIKPTWEPFDPKPDDLVIEIDPVMAFEVIVQSLHQFMHGEELMVEDIVFDGCQGIRDRTDTDTLDVFGVVACAAGIVVLALGDAVIGDDRQERSGHVLRVDALDPVGARDLDVDEVAHLAAVGIPQFFIGGVIFRFSGM